jgi:hypothetical protein
MTSAWEADIALKFGIRMKWQMGMKRRREEEKKRRGSKMHARTVNYLYASGR